ncbi:MAG: tetratricopeptide repeat protein [Verrucomicrobiae bacterium]|nr:tetratricopeptide repeat protein [Verrucomicrobiae bacterium]
MRWVFHRPVSFWECVRWWLYALVVSVLAAAHYRVEFRDRVPWERPWFWWREADREEAMYRALMGNDPVLAQRAAAALWEHWFSERGAAAREQLETGLAAVRAGDWEIAEQVLVELMNEHPDWAEAINGVAMLRYRQRRYAESAALCRRVLELKPRHFGAWSGLAHCAIHQGDWALARFACRQAMRVQPHEAEHRRVLHLVELHIPALDV